MGIHRAGGEALLTIAHDDEEYWATSSLASLSSVGEVRSALAELREWAEGTHAGCGAAGYKVHLDKWIAYSLHLMRRLDERDLLSAVPRRAEEAWDEAASYAYNLHRVTDLSMPPHLASTWDPAEG